MYNGYATRRDYGVALAGFLNRHWCASLLIAYDVQPKVIQAILGHADISTTMDIYGHLLPQVLKGATDRMSGIVPTEKEEETGEEST